ncbi:right-handed parallel beta-helix repeat-containing protein, partial [bacterium]|nr:right-handed parallel beta-helix repeat-containing protein [bacterium]
KIPAQWSKASRDPDQFVTILSGEIGDPNSRTDNSLRIIDNDGSAQDLGDCTILDGFVIEGGYGTNGVGMRNLNASPVIRDCVFRGLYASASGGAIDNQGTAAPLFAACQFYNNESGSTGGAFSNYGSGNPLIVNSVFQGNRSGGAGGAIYSEVLTTVINGSFSLNQSGGLGGAVFGQTPDSVQVANSILWGNTASEGVSVEQGQVIGAAVTDSIVHGLDKLTGNRNIALDPLFMDPSQYDLRLSVYSPAIDRGAAGKDPSGQTMDAWNQARLFGAQVDLGAFEVQSVSPGSLGIIEGYSVVELADGQSVLRLLVTDGSAAGIVWQVDRGAGFEDLISDAFHEFSVDGAAVQLRIVLPSFSMNEFKYRYRVNASAPAFASFPVTLKVAPAIRVNQATGDDNNDGLSWGQAVKSIQKGLSLATTEGEIWVAAGTYYPTDGGDSGRGASFEFGQRVSIYGGFRGDEGTRVARDRNLNPTILSGDIGTIGVDSDNSYHVLEHRSANASNGTHLDGVIVQRGNASGSGYQQDYGGGIFVYSGTMTLRNTMIRDNKASWRGGAAAIEQGKLHLEGALVYNNSAVSSSGGIVVLSGDVFLTNTTVTENTSESRTAGIDVFPGGHLTVANSILHNNRASGVAADLESQQLTGNASVFNSIVEGLDRYRSGSSFAIDPLFADPENDDFSLSAFSGAIGRGDNALLPSGYSLDLVGVDRVLPANVGTVDLGTYEYGGAVAGALEVVQFPSFAPLIGGGELKVVVTPSFRNRIVWQIDRGDGTFVDLVADSVHSIVLGADSSTLKVYFPDANLTGARYRFRVSGTAPEYVSDSAILRLLPVLKVDADAGAGGDGLTWTTAFRTIQEAFAALPTIGHREIWVAEGTYYPSLNNARGDSFEMQNNLVIYGGFQGGDDSESLNDRDWKSFPAILSGNIGDANSVNDNSKRIIFNRGSSGINASAVLDGFFIQAGNGEAGAGIYNFAASPTIRHCHFRNNVVTGRGGAMHGVNSSPIVSDCVFESNEAQVGGSVYVYLGKSEFRRCQFLDSQATQGGGLSVENSAALFENCLFAGNHATGSGGYYGGAIAVSYFDAEGKIGKTRFLNCTVVDNSSAGGAAGIELSPTPFGPVEVHNSILWNNLARGVANFESQLKGNGIGIRHSMVNGISDFGGNIASPPDFVAPSQNDYRLTACSFGINVGDNAAIPLPSLDLAGNPRLFDGLAETDVVDMGAYEFASEVPANRLVLNTSPVSRPVQEGANATFLVAAVGDELSYQWQGDDKGNGVFSDLSDSVPYSGVTSATLIVTAIPATLNLTQYRCVVLASFGCRKISGIARLSVRFSTIFVDADANGNADGSSWGDAYTGLQTAINAAASLNTEIEIWIAKGTYYPSGINSGQRDKSFMMYPKVALLGGFSGDEDAVTDRDWDANLTILSGNIGDPADDSDNIKNVVIASSPDIGKRVDRTAVLDGLMIEKGYGPGGGALIIDGAS